MGYSSQYPPDQREQYFGRDNSNDYPRYDGNFFPNHMGYGTFGGMDYGNNWPFSPSGGGYPGQMNPAGAKNKPATTNYASRGSSTSWLASASGSGGRVGVKGGLKGKGLGISPRRGKGKKSSAGSGVGKKANSGAKTGEKSAAAAGRGTVLKGNNDDKKVGSGSDPDIKVTDVDGGDEQKQVPTETGNLAVEDRGEDEFKESWAEQIEDFVNKLASD